MKEEKVRTYRLLNRQKDLVYFQILVKETDLDIGIPARYFSQELVNKTKQKLLALRGELEEYIAKDRGFLLALEPYRPGANAPEIAAAMAEAGSRAGVGPMAAVAGAFAEFIGRDLARRCREVIVENGGDIYLVTRVIRRIGIYAGRSPFSYRIALEIQPYQSPLGVCTSSGTVGHSLSFGSADAVVVLAPSALLADAAATAAANQVKSTDDLLKAVEFALSIPSVIGAVAIKGDKMAVKGQVKLVPC